jgi:uncharacterized membrane protein
LSSKSRDRFLELHLRMSPLPASHRTPLIRTGVSDDQAWAGERTQIAAARRSRVEPIDIVRGVIMILMALDHTRDFFGVPGLNPVNLSTTTPALFFTRWVTHFCAPVFFLLTGTGARLALRRRTTGELSRFLILRGIWLIALDLVIARCLAYQFNADFRVTMLLVLWALGWAMITLGLLVHLPVSVVVILGIVTIAGHDLFDSVRSTSSLWAILHAPGIVLNRGDRVVFVSYPLIPWLGVTAAGYGLGQPMTGIPAGDGAGFGASDSARLLRFSCFEVSTRTEIPPHGMCARAPCSRCCRS